MSRRVVGAGRAAAVHTAAARIAAIGALLVTAHVAAAPTPTAAAPTRPNRAAQEMLHARSIRQAAEFYEQGCSERSNQSRRSLWEPADREEEPYLHYWGNKWRVVGK